ncbi:MAG TPA: HAD-IA family hydrolase [Candidatus Bathyarchaeia archaeon]|nr:HAD-IA family hydrolase [Candidatus Bathyarchaeia archaeon]
MIKAVIFDMDGVIVDSEPMHIEAEKRILLKHGARVSTDELRTYTGTTAEFEFTDLIQKYRLNTTVDRLFREKEAILFKLLEKKTKPTKGVIRLIKSLKKCGLRLAIASSGHRKLVQYFLRKLKIARLFDSVVCAEDISRSKPDPEIFLKAARSLGLGPAECIVIEDSKLGVEAAKSAGMKCIAYRNPNSGNQDLSKADMVIDDFSKPDVQTVVYPYPKEYEAYWKLRDGRTVLLRPIKPEDEPLWLDMFKEFSEEAIRYRFFELIKDTPHEVRARYCKIDYSREMAIVAELTEDGRRKILGVVRLSIESDRKTGEIAFIVADTYQGLGLGTKFVEYMVKIGRGLGLESIYGIMLPDNVKAIRLAKKMGFVSTHLKDGTFKVTLDLK